MTRLNSKSKMRRTSYLLLSILLITVTAYFVSTTLARYQSNANAVAVVDIAKWAIKLNSYDITSASTTVTPEVSLEGNEYVAEERIAPGRSGTFRIELDPTGSEVSIDYYLTVDVDNISGIVDPRSAISVTDVVYQIGSGAETIASLTNESFSIFEPLANVVSGDKVSVDITVEWNNEGDANNSGDTVNGLSGNEITVPVTILARQHI